MSSPSWTTWPGPDISQRGCPPPNPGFQTYFDMVGVSGWRLGCLGFRGRGLTNPKECMWSPLSSLTFGCWIIVSKYSCTTQHDTRIACYSTHTRMQQFTCNNSHTCNNFQLIHVKHTLIYLTHGHSFFQIEASTHKIYNTWFTIYTLQSFLTISIVSLRGGQSWMLTGLNQWILIHSVVDRGIVRNGCNM